MITPTERLYFYFSVILIGVKWAWNRTDLMSGISYCISISTQTLLKPHLSGHWKFASKMEAEQCVGGKQYWIPYVYQCPHAAIFVNYVTIIYTPLISVIASIVVRHDLLCNAPYIMLGNYYCHNAAIRVSDKILTKMIFGVTVIYCYSEYQ